MKKNRISMLALVAAFTMTATSVEAQIQPVSHEEFEEAIAITDNVDDTKDQEEFLDKSVKSENVEMAQPEEQNITIDYLAPLGGEILLLSCLGGAYLLSKKRKEND